MMLALFAFLAGAVMSLRFNFLILVPTILAAWTIVLIGGLAAAMSASSIILLMTMVAAALQLGYLGGILYRCGFAAMRANRRGHWPVKPETGTDPAF